MNLLSSREYETLIDVVEQANPHVYTYEAHILDIDNEYKPIRLVYLRIFRDYIGNLGEKIEIGLFMTASFHAQVMQFMQQDVMLRLTATPIYVKNRLRVKDKPIIKKEYKLVITKLNNEILESNHKYVNATKDMDLDNQDVYRFELLSPSLEEMRLMYTHGLYGEATPKDIILGLGTLSISKIKNKKPEIKGIDIVEPDNKEKRPLYYFPVDDVKSLEVPNYIQKYQGGVYNSGIGSFIQDDIWYVWPLYDYQRFKKTNKTLTILNAHSDALAGNHKNHSYKDGKLTLVSSGKVIFKEIREKTRMNEGRGSRFIKADQNLESFRKLNPVFDSWEVNLERSQMLDEFVFDPKEGRDNLTETRLNPIKGSQNKITDNKYHVVSEVKKKLGNLLIVTWDNSDPDLIYPGMPVKYVFMTRKGPHYLEGILLSHEYRAGLPNGSLIHEEHINVSTLVVYIEPVHSLKDVGNTDLKNEYKI